MRCFISYRRVDTQAYADKLYDHLYSRYGDTVTLDDPAVDYGENYPAILNEALYSCDVLIVLIGKSWLTVTNKDGKRRLDDPNDWVTKEVEAGIQRAHNRKALVLPVLVDGATMPSEVGDDLPTRIKGLATIKAIRWDTDRDIEAILDTLESYEEQLPKPLSLPERISKWMGRHWYVMVFMLLLIALGAYYLYDLSLMHGTFNIAIAPFEENAANAQIVSPILSDAVFDYLQNSYSSPEFEGMNVEVRQVAPVADMSAARALADRIRADLVIFGSVRLGSNGEGVVVPQFYVADRLRWDINELTGSFPFTGIAFNANDLNNADSVSVLRLNSIAAVLVEFTKGLVDLTLERNATAQIFFERAIDLSENAAEYIDRAFLYVFAATAARYQKDFTAATAYALEALEINENYGRAYIALGAIEYDQAIEQWDRLLANESTDLEKFATHLDNALSHYETASAMSATQEDDLFEHRLNIAFGNLWLVYSWVAADSNVRPQFAANARSYFEPVIEAYTVAPSVRVREFAAQAYYGIGALEKTLGNLEAARENYQRSLDLTRILDMRRRAEGELASVAELIRENS